MHIDVVTTSEGLAALAADWIQLDEQDARSEFYTSYPCVASWWGSFGGDSAYDLHLLIARHNGQVAAILPLARQRRQVRGVSGTMLRFASHGDWMGVVMAPGIAPDTVCGDFLRHLDADPDWDELRLDHLRGQSHLTAYAFASAQWNRRLEHRVEHPVIDMTGAGDLDSVTVPAKTRKYRNRLRRDHDVRFVVRQGDDGDMLERLGRLHQAERDFLIAERDRTERHSWFDDPLRAGHYRGLFAGYPGSVVTFCYERPDGELIAARSAFRHRRTLLSWTSAYHPDFHNYRLGKVIQLDILDYLVARADTDSFDFGAGRYPWKFEWTSRFDSSYRLRVVRGAAPSPGRTPPPAAPAPDPAPGRGAGPPLLGWRARLRGRLG